MVNFSYEVINQIRSAPDDSRVEKIIENSIRNFNQKRNNSSIAKRRYLMNMEMALKYTKAEGLSPKETHNVTMAIQIFENSRKKDLGDIF